MIEDTIEIIIKNKKQLTEEEEAKQFDQATRALEEALKLDNAIKYIEGKSIKKVIYVPGRVINIIV